MVDVRLENVYPVRCESESWLAKARQDTLSCSPDKPSSSRHQPCILYFSPPLNRSEGHIQLNHNVLYISMKSYTMSLYHIV
jgi:hypothetical protein